MLDELLLAGYKKMDLRHISNFVATSDYHANFIGLQALEPTIPGFKDGPHFFLGDIAVRGVQPVETWEYILDHPNKFLVGGDCGIGCHIIDLIDRKLLDRERTYKDLVLSYKGPNLASLEWTHEVLKTDLSAFSFADTDVNWKIHAEMQIAGQDANVLFCHGHVTGDKTGSVLVGRQLAMSEVYSVLKAEQGKSFRPDPYQHFRRNVNIGEDFLGMFGHLNDHFTSLVVSGHTHTPHVIVAEYDNVLNIWSLYVDSFDEEPNFTEFERIGAEIEVRKDSNGFSRTYHGLLTPELLTIPNSGYQRFKRQVFVMVGSAGAPRDGLNMVCGSRFDLATANFTLYASTYDSDTVRNLIRSTASLGPNKEALAVNIDK